MAPHVIKDSYLDVLTKKINELAEKAWDEYYLVFQIIIWMMISSISTYFLIKIDFLNIF